MALLRTILLSLLALAAAAATPAAEDVELFEKRIRPIFAAKCQMCHSAQIKTAELDLSSAEGFVRGGASGPLVNLESPADSILLKVVSYDEKLKMPPMAKLPPEEVAALTEWVERGAPWPGAEQVAPIEKKADQVHFTSEQKSYWAFQPIADPAPPAVKNSAWARSPIDQFVLAGMEPDGVAPAPEADKATLLRRVTFDLTGLPPTPEEIAAFLADRSQNAFEKVVDRLLASPRYGERWGRHWLDVARYADSTGNDEDHRYPYAWRYRDYVIDSFNNDRPFNRFVMEQIAGDLLPSPDGRTVNERGVVATGFLAIGPKALAQQDKKLMVYDVYDEQVDVVSKAFLGLTVSCARCHDHKFDPILTRDYYSLIGFFADTRSFRDPESHVSKLLFVPLVEQHDWAEYERQQEEIRRAKFELENTPEIEVEEWVEPHVEKLAAYMLAARRVYEDGESIDAVVADSGLERYLLERWVNYLTPGDEVRAHMAEWDNAPRAERAAVAAAFAESFQTQREAWVKKLRNWRNRVNRPAEEITMGIPAKPRFEPGENRFFHQVYIAGSGPLSFRSKDDLQRILKPETRELIASLERKAAELEANAMPEPPRANAVEDKAPDERVRQHVFVRGDYSSKGEPAPKAFPAILAGPEQEPVRTDGSGRLELAEWIASDSNPLTARVIVNRVWQWHFGEGLVRTPNNFGRMGEKPTHPELLDYLAKRFIEDGWSLKKLHKRMLLTSTYRMSSEVNEAKASTDPENRLLSRFNRRRLDVEELRDGLLAADGSIDLSMGGTMQEGFGTDGENSNDRLSINPDEHVRRTVYLPLRRANLPALLNLYDFGDAATSQGRRAKTNVAPQALFLMNSSFVAERARGLASRLLERDDDASRLRQAYLQILNRAPEPDEADVGLTYLASVRERFDGVAPLDAWQSFCRILMSSNEFIYVD
jgi:hypothetical protein